MTKRHLEALADALGRTDAPTATIAAVARVCAGANPRFDRGRFERVVAEVKHAHGHV